MEYDLIIVESFDFGPGSGIVYRRGERVSCPQEIRAILGKGADIASKVRVATPLAATPLIEPFRLRGTDRIAIYRP